MSDNKRDFDKDAALWDENPARVKLAKDVCAAISQKVPLNSSMGAMDFGCGTGLLTLGLAPFVGTITGIDTSPGMLDVLRQKINTRKISNANVGLIDLEHGGILKESYDLIASSMTFHHIEKFLPILKQFYGHIKPNGYICIADLDPDQGLFHDDNKGVMHFGLERDAMRQAFTDAGFSEISDTTAAEVIKPVSTGEMRRFTVFLIVGKKSDKGI